MPNQLSKSKRRQSLAEHEAVLAALAAIARRDNTTVMALLRQATRELVKQRAGDPTLRKTLQQLIFPRAPQMPKRFTTAAQVARFKRAQREFDQVLLDLELSSPQDVQQHNSVVSSRQAIHVIDFSQAYASSAV
jgi:chorismate mutase